eukprot:CAMPEP_0183586708 /NCGR_PEP_ID=MMETSP0371-20130417/157663_1 /TAXON_ID=268820 /ORGANISM="Peridinium aciculiferum, Strain PAER-2" /LENGTH=45 /DNA_ID= /DNA_START= /DNA_END= /DNA_ORIENTATION=
MPDAVATPPGSGTCGRSLNGRCTATRRGSCFDNRLASAMAEGSTS